MEDKINIDVGEIYHMLCPECQKKLVSAVASRIQTKAVEKELEKQWKKTGDEP